MLSAAEGRRLLEKHLTGEFGRGTWPTIASLLKKGMIAEQGKRLVVTPKGKAWCDANHMSVSLSTVEG